MKVKKSTATLSAIVAVSLGITGAAIASASSTNATVSVKAMADALHLVMDSDRSVYTKKIVNRLVKKEKVIKATEHFEDDKALALPAQMFRFGSEMAMKRAEKMDDVNFSYTLQSLWPINRQNAPKTKAEREGLKFVAENKGKNYYTTETLGGQKYFTAVYADTGVAPVCVSCHNKHPDTPKNDFKLGDVMGGVVIRIPIDS
ncbi:MAG: DUF3365 domain-containing protein [Gammaproteobacteria bacterium]|nr:DUF3365 domain-containing protein [Gammaproteobacteria bacterium]